MTPTAMNPSLRETTKVRNAFALCAASFAIAGVIDIAINPTFAGEQLHTVADYVMAAWLIPLAISMLYLATRMRALHRDRPGRLWTAGIGLLAAAVGLFCIDAVATLATGEEHILGPLYPIATLTSFIAVVLIAVKVFRARLMPAWAGPALAIGWIIGGPIAPLGALFFLPALACALLATRAAAWQGGSATASAPA